MAYVLHSCAGMTLRKVSGGVAVMWFVVAVACGSSDGDDITPRTCRSGDSCSEGAECSFEGNEWGVHCHCDPSGHFFCDPSGGGGAPPWEPCTEQEAKGTGGACAEPATSCTETNGFCTRTCACGGGPCEMVCDGESAANVDRSALCDESYCDMGGFGRCEFIDAECNYKVECDVNGEGVTMTGSCP